jgi:hypothetical protein
MTPTDFCTTPKPAQNSNSNSHTNLRILHQNSLCQKAQKSKRAHCKNARNFTSEVAKSIRWLGDFCTFGARFVRVQNTARRKCGKALYL